jgi:hypothetical protein
MYSLRIWSPATIILGLLVIANSAGNCAMRSRSRAGHTIRGCTIPGLPRAPRYIQGKEQMRRSRCPLLFRRFRPFRHRGFWRHLPKLGLQEKSHIVSESGVFPGHGSICCALHFCSAMDRTISRSGALRRGEVS